MSMKSSVEISSPAKRLGRRRSNTPKPARSNMTLPESVKHYEFHLKNMKTY